MSDDTKEVKLLKLEIERLRGLLEISAKAHASFGQGSLALRIMKSLNKGSVLDE